MATAITKNGPVIAHVRTVAEDPVTAGDRSNDDAQDGNREGGGELAGQHRYEHQPSVTRLLRHGPTALRRRSLASAASLNSYECRRQ